MKRLSETLSPVPRRDTSLIGLACEHLRRVGFTAVYRTDEPNMYIAGSLKLTSGEVIDLAETTGFDSTKAITNG